MKRRPTALLLTGILVSLISCTTKPQEQLKLRGLLPGGEGKNAPSWEVTIADSHAALTLPYGEKVIIRGEAFPSQGGSWTVYTDEMLWFGNWEKGWTEARFSLTGSFELIPRGQGWQLRVQEMPQINTVEEGVFRHKEEKVFGDRARDTIARRWTRSKRAGEYLGEALGRRTYPFPDIKGRYEKGETVFAEMEAALFGGPGNPPENLPEDLVPVVESGTLAGDYEESRGLIYLALTWNYMWEEVLPHSTITNKE